MEEYQSKVNGILSALSTLISDPKELLEILRNNPHVIEVAKVLESYHVDKSIVDIAENLATTSYMLGFGQSDASYEEMVLNDYYKEIPRQVIDECLKEDYEKANQILVQLKNRSLNQIWGEISNNDRLHILYEKISEKPDVELTEPEKESFEILNQYSSKTLSLQTEIDNVIQKLSPERCWKAGPPTPDMIIDGLNRFLQSDDPSVDKLEIENAIKAFEQLQKLESRVKDINKIGLEVLNNNGIKTVQTEDFKKQLFFVLHKLFESKLITEKINDDGETLLDAVRELIS